jgi:ATP-dependent DNA helicase RecQ
VPPDLLAADFMKWRVMLESNGELTDANLTLMRQMERYAASVGCRHQHLAEYFGDSYARDGCGACDYCLEELDQATAPVVLARQIPVLRGSRRAALRRDARGQRTGGQTNEQVVARGHGALSTFGLLPTRRWPKVRGYIQQLIAFGCCVRPTTPIRCWPDSARHRPSERRDRATLAWLWFVSARRARMRRARVPVWRRSRWQDVDRNLFERLRAVAARHGTSTRRTRPTSSFTTRHCARWPGFRPTSIDALLTVKGIGARKADDLGEIFLTAIREHAL